jgi:hypothetical protein
MCHQGNLSENVYLPWKFRHNSVITTKIELKWLWRQGVYSSFTTKLNVQRINYYSH